MRALLFDPPGVLIALGRVPLEPCGSPEPGWASTIYEDLYRSVYLPMYDRLRPLYREIRRITGYPR